MKSRTYASLAGALTLAMLLAACGGGGAGVGGPSGSAGVLPVQPPNSTGPVSNATTSNFSWGQSFLKELTYSGPAQQQQQQRSLSVTILLNMNFQGLQQYAQQVNNPKSPLYRHWLTPQQIGAQFGASSTNYASVATYFKKYGLAVGGWPQHEVLNVAGSITQFQKAFGTTFGTYMFQGKRILAPTGAPHFSTPLPVTAVYGLVAATTEQTYFIKGNNASSFGYAPQQLATGFDFSGAWNAGIRGSGIDVGIIGTGPILDANGNDDDTAGLASFWHTTLAPVSQVAAVDQPADTAVDTVNNYENSSFLTAPPPVTGPCNFTGDYTKCNPEDGEAQLDTQSIASLAPSANVLFYLAYQSYCINASTLAAYAPPCSSGDFTQQWEGIQLVDDEIQQAIADNKADVLSLSFGEAENVALASGYIGGSNTLGQAEFESLSTEGIAVFASSGDNGAWDCPSPTTFGVYLGMACVSYPASDPNVVGVGGVNIPLDENGNLTGSITAWADNTTLGGNGSFGNNVGSGGGVSAAFTPPPWQAATIRNIGGGRMVPDMSLDADPLTGPSVLIDALYGGVPVPIGGTSAAAPESAAQWGIVLQACKASATCNTGGATGYRLGDPAPLLYSIYGTSASAPNLAAAAYTIPNFTPQLTYANTFYDVMWGDNQAVPPLQSPAPATTPGGYSAGPGYDQVTGLGAPFTGHLIQAITGTKVP